ncbi:MAG: hypothetical protein APF76_04620 [Desulfitibacter sp. BRH_c19]|nr:MAG: hypothetical protein APF76_04620 [Desulfitibacter sp. BRH_c19]
MSTLNVILKNCYGIKDFEQDFVFTTSTENPKAKAYVIYAPNGVMKTSFTKTFEDISRGEQPKEERYHRPTTCKIKLNESPISKETIYVLKSEIDIKSENPAITNILVNPEHKARYDELLIELDKLKNKLIGTLQKLSKVKKNDIEQVILKDWDISDFPTCITKTLEHSAEDDLEPYEYATIFDPKAIEILNSQEFILKANEFNNRYQELFNSDGSIYTKGVFNPTKAETSFETLKKQGYFMGGHRVHLRGDEFSISQDELDQRHKRILERLDTDETLKKLRINLAKNAKTHALVDLIESLTYTQVEFLLDKLKPENQGQFRQNLWSYYMQKSPDAEAYLRSFNVNKDELQRIEAEASQIAPRWTQAVDLFNDRFVDMPFTLFIANQTEVTLGKENAQLRFIFRDGNDSVEWSRSELKTLSQGEKRALYLLSFIFEVESRKLNSQETLFVVDDIADSFDYKNKHAITQYLRDLTNTEYFYQIILTHNYDFFRTLATTYVHRDRCLMTIKNNTSICLAKAEGVKNYFIGKWKNNINRCDIILCATIPFSRNLIEYTKGESDPDYIKLTSLLHWKKDTDEITIGDYLYIYNSLFGTNYSTNNQGILKNLLFQKADEICRSDMHDGLNLENKVLLCMAIRINSEIFMTEKLRILKNDSEYWCSSNSQFGYLIKEFTSLSPSAPAIRTLEKVSITASSNIHLNSFMYEPILDLTIEHLIKLYNEVVSLNTR